MSYRKKPCHCRRELICPQSPQRGQGQTASRTAKPTHSSPSSRWNQPGTPSSTAPTKLYSKTPPPSRSPSVMLPRPLPPSVRTAIAHYSNNNLTFPVCISTAENRWSPIRRLTQRELRIISSCWRSRTRHRPDLLHLHSTPPVR